MAYDFRDCAHGTRYFRCLHDIVGVHRTGCEVCAKTGTDVQLVQYNPPGSVAALMASLNQDYNNEPARLAEIPPETGIHGMARLDELMSGRTRRVDTATGLP